MNKVTLNCNLVRSNSFLFLVLFFGESHHSGFLMPTQQAMMRKFNRKQMR